MKITRREAIYRGIVQATIVLAVTRILSPEDLPLIGPLFRTINQNINRKDSKNFIDNSQILVTLMGLEGDKTSTALIKFPGYEGLLKLTLINSYDSHEKKVIKANEKLRTLEQNIGKLIWIPLMFEEQWECEDYTKSLWTFRKGKLPASEIKIISREEYLAENNEKEGTISLIKGYGQIRYNPTEQREGLELIIDTPVGEFSALLSDSPDRCLQTLKELLVPNTYVEFGISSKDRPPKLYFNEGYAPAHLVNLLTTEELNNLPK